MNKRIEQIFDISSSELVKEFPNGFNSWQETHGEICIAIGAMLNNENSVNEKIEDINENSGRFGILRLAKQLTDKFEVQYKGVEWGEDIDSSTGKEYDFFVAIDLFLTENL